MAKLAQTSFYPAFNNVDDITMDPKFCAACGITEEEFEARFACMIPELLEYNRSMGHVPGAAMTGDLKAMIRERYFGYSWDGSNRVYNPYSLVRLKSDKTFGDHRYRTGNPSHILGLISERPEEYVRSETGPVSGGTLRSLDVGNVRQAALLFQAVYLTADRVVGADSYTLKGPDWEVDRPFFLELLYRLTDTIDGETVDALLEMVRVALDDRDHESLAAGLGRILRRIPRQRQEGLVAVRHAAIGAVLKALRFTVES